MEVVILTGMSGAGKSVAVNYLEDLGYFCVDNAPPQMLHSMLKTFLKWEKEEGVSVNKVGFVVDVRSAVMFSGVLPAFAQIEKMGIQPRIIFLDASDQTIVNRYKQSRRNHPLAEGKGILQGIAEERELMSKIKSMVPDVIDTTNIEPWELRDTLYRMLSGGKEENKLAILVQSFGFKYGIPLDCDNVVDVRFIPNPFYISELKGFSGLDDKVKEYIYTFPETNEFMKRLKELTLYTIPYYTREGKIRLNIGVGCTGGRHRSVAMAEDLGEFLKSKGFNVIVDHRDLKNDVEAKAKSKSKSRVKAKQKQ
ncbi:MAG: RNase adapter RapZ [Saccharofermentanales bacterium]